MSPVIEKGETDSITELVAKVSAQFTGSKANNRFIGGCRASPVLDDFCFPATQWLHVALATAVEVRGCASCIL